MLSVTLIALAVSGEPPPIPADTYLCEVYARTPVKRDGAGDFTWKDQAAANRLGMDVCTYAIGGLAPGLKTRLETFGHMADERGIAWSMTSGFRDDFRQGIASGLKARVGNSKHGGSRATRGYGDGRAVDIAAVGPIAPLLALVDGLGRTLGLTRPHKGFDPNHVQLLDGSTPRLAKVRHAKHIKRRHTRIAAR